MIIFASIYDKRDHIEDTALPMIVREPSRNNCGNGRRRETVTVSWVGRKLQSAKLHGVFGSRSERRTFSGSRAA